MTILEAWDAYVAALTNGRGEEAAFNRLMDARFSYEASLTPASEKEAVQSALAEVLDALIIYNGFVRPLFPKAAFTHEMLLNAVDALAQELRGYEGGTD